MTLNSKWKTIVCSNWNFMGFQNSLNEWRKKNKKTKQTKWAIETSTQSHDKKFYEADIFITAIATGNNGQISSISSTNNC